MATIRTYFTQARTIHAQIARRMGVDVTRGVIPDRVGAYSALAMLCVVIKLLVDKGVISDADLQAAFNAVTPGVDFDPEPLEPAGP